MSIENPFPTVAPEAKPPPGLVPAVERAAAILAYLQQNADVSACTLTRIANALSLHKSSCSNILRTLESAMLVEYDPDSKAYLLGATLIGLGAVATQRRDILQVGQRPIENLVRETGLSCVTFAQVPDKQFLILAKTDSARAIKVTIDVGQYFAAGTPALARIAMATMTHEDALRYIGAYCLPGFTPATKTGQEDILGEVEEIRRLGYAVSEGEYYAGNTAVVAPIFSAQDEVCRGICLIGFSSQIDRKELPALGAKVRETAQVITRAIGGRDRLQASGGRARA